MTRTGRRNVLIRIGGVLSEIRAELLVAVVMAVTEEEAEIAIIEEHNN